MKNPITESYLKLEFEKTYSKLKKERYLRFKQVQKYFPNGPGDITVFSGIEARWILEELCSAYINGNYMTCVIFSQIIMERALASNYAMTDREDEIFKKGFKVLIDEAKKDGHVAKTLIPKLHRLRRIRNPYNHPYVGLRKNSIIERITIGELKKKRYKSLYTIVKKDAQFSIQLVSSFYKSGRKKYKQDVV